MSNKVLLVDDVHPYLIQRLESNGLLCHYQPNFTYEQTQKVIADYVGLVIRTKFKVDEKLIAQAHQLKFIARAGAGMDNIDVLSAEKKNISCLNAPEGNRDAVAEHAIGLLLALANKIASADKQVRNAVWDREANRGWEIGGKTIGIIGFGNTGSALAKKLSGFGMNILAYDKYKTGFAHESDMSTVFSEADILSLHIPLTAETKQLVNADFLSRFKKPLVLLNTSRGEIVHTTELLSALKTKKIIAAGLDVLEDEKFPTATNNTWFNELKNMENVVLTPHVAGWSRESYQKISEVLAQKILALKLIK